MIKLLVVGYGAMGQRVVDLAPEKGFKVVGIVSPDQGEAGEIPFFENFQADLPDFDVLIDFSHPTLTLEYLNSDLDKPLVVATTGDKEEITDKLQEKGKTQPVFFSANMSYGVHVLTQLVRYATPLLEDWDVELLEKHHQHKVDAPSGTLIKLLDAIKEEARPDAKEVYDRHELSQKRDPNEIGISVIRGGTIVGEHDVFYAGVDEEITLTHRAQSKNIFANGALTVAKKLIDKEAGYYTFDNL